MFARNSSMSKISQLASLAFNYNINVLVCHLRTPKHLTLSLLHKMTLFCMNTAKKVLGRTPFKHSSLRSYYTHKYCKINIKTFQQVNTLLLRVAVSKQLCKTHKAMSCPSTKPSHKQPSPPHVFFFFKNLLRFKKKILSSVYLEINFPAGP